MFSISWLNPHTPHDCCVRFVSVVAGAHATLTTERPATALLGPDFHRLDHASFAWRTDNLSPKKIQGLAKTLDPLI
jgi:hypothetical protein